MEMRQMLEQRREFLRHQQVQFAGGKMFAQGAEGRREQHRVTEVFELQGGFFQAARSRRELQFVKFLINAATPDQFLVAAGFHDAAPVEHHDQIRVQNG